MTREGSLVWSDELQLSCGRFLLPEDGGHLHQTTQHTAGAAGNPGSLLQELVEMLQHRACRVLWKLVEMSLGPMYLTARLCRWWHNFSSEAPGNSLPPPSSSINRGCYSKRAFE